MLLKTQDTGAFEHNQAPKNRTNKKPGLKENSRNLLKKFKEIAISIYYSSRAFWRKKPYPPESEYCGLTNFSI